MRLPESRSVEPEFSVHAGVPPAQSDDSHLVSRAIPIEPLSLGVRE